MYKFVLTILCFILPQICISAEFTGNAQFNYNPNMYTAKDALTLVKKANDYLRLYENTENKELKEKHLKEAQRYYYICTRADYSNIECHIGLGKTYDEMGIDKYAKMEFNSAYNIDNKNPKLNYRYGDFYYKRKQLSQAQNYFERAYKYGYSKNLDLNIKMSKTYTKLAEPQKAEQHMKIANEIKNMQKQQKTKAAVSSTIKQASGLAVAPVTTNKTHQTTTKNVQTEQAKSSNINEEVLNANKIKMIDEKKQVQPLYYLYIK